MPSGPASLPALVLAGMLLALTTVRAGESPSPPPTQEPAQPEETPDSPAGEEPAVDREKPSLRVGFLSAEARRAMVLDGRLSEAVWATADSISNLTMIEPEEGGIPAGRTVVRVLANQNEIVIGVRCFDPDPAGILSFSKARDTELDEEDHVLFVLDTFADERSGFVFAVNPGGSRFDGLVTAQGTDVNSSWDTIWQAGTAIDASGWCAEIRLPIMSLSFKKGLTHWGFNVERRVQRLQETSRWAGAKLDFEIFQTSQAGILSGLPAFDLGLGLAVRPGLVGEAKQPFPGSPREFDRQISLDANQKLGSNLAAILTVNTDFGETETDARQTNLSRFDVLFPEKRAFFLEGADIFEFGLGLDLESATVIPFFSRTIGLYTPEGEDEGTEVPLRAGGKLLGRIGNTNLGALVAATDQVDAFGVPRSQMGAVRVRQNVFSESSIGAIGTFGDPLDRPGSWLGGADFTYQTSHFQQDKNLMFGVWGLTTGREGLGGDRNAFGGKFAYPNDELDVGVTYLHVGDDFKPSLGFVQRTGQMVDATLDYTWRPRASLVRRWAMGGSYFSVVNPDGEWESYSATIKPIDLQFESGDRFQVEIGQEGEHPTESFDVFDSPAKTVEILEGAYHWTRYTLLGTLASKRAIGGEISWSFGGFYDGDLQTIETALVLKPFSALTFQLTTERNMATLPEDEFTQYLYGVRTEIKVSPELQATNFLQYDNESRSLGSSSRLRWSFLPLADLFVAYNHNMTRSVEDPRWEFASDQFLVKLQYAVRL